ncbi:MAG: cytidine deaminase [Clostridiales bacterium]|nr:MAG: cytidine deaminase [Clostridiales bacterium]
MRKDYISWEDYFMAIASLSAMRSKDPVTQVGACIVDRDHKIVSVGYNGMPYGTEDISANWSKDGKWEDTKYPYVCHAELNAILNSPRSVKGCIIYVTHHPCNECAKAIVQSGISEVIFNNDKEGKESDVAKIILDNANIKVKKHRADFKNIGIRL